jgi:hypothetical protein
VSGTTYVGGLVGFNLGTITNSYATGSVSGTNNVGGLVGYTYRGSIADSYATGTVTSPGIAGGLIGQAESYTTIENSYATGLVSGGTTQGGLLGVDRIRRSLSPTATGTPRPPGRPTASGMWRTPQASLA